MKRPFLPRPRKLDQISFSLRLKLTDRLRLKGTNNRTRVGDDQGLLIDIRNRRWLPFPFGLPHKRLQHKTPHPVVLSEPGHGYQRGIAACRPSNQRPEVRWSAWARTIEFQLF